MRYGVLGTGTVGRTLAGKLEELGHEVRVGSRQAGEEKVPFEEAAAFGEVVINATAGAASLEALGQAGADNLAGKVLIDVSTRSTHRGGSRRFSPCTTTTAWASRFSASSRTPGW
jgi:predicted dinucleotide-binding enzyme